MLIIGNNFVPFHINHPGITKRINPNIDHMMATKSSELLISFIELNKAANPATGNKIQIIVKIIFFNIY